MSGVELPPVIELPRYCAVHDGEIWLARYLLREGVYEFNTGIVLTRRLQGRYAPENAVALPAGFRADAEECACCGAWSFDDWCNGAVWCTRCNARVCYGRTTRSRYFHCRESCGGEGQLRPCPEERMALAPGGRGGNFGTR